MENKKLFLARARVESTRRRKKVKMILFLKTSQLMLNLWGIIQDSDGVSSTSSTDSGRNAISLHVLSFLCACQLGLHVLYLFSLSISPVVRCRPCGYVSIKYVGL